MYVNPDVSSILVIFAFVAISNRIVAVVIRDSLGKSRENYSLDKY